MGKKHTPAPWAVGYSSPELYSTSTLAVWNKDVLDSGFGSPICKVSPEATMNDEDKANAQLIAAAPDLLEEMQRYLPVLEWAETMPEIWQRATKGTGIATANGYRNAITKATGGQP